MWYRRNILLVLLFSGIICLNAQDISFVLNAPAIVEKGGQIQLSYTLSNGKGEDFKMPDKVDGFEIIYGPSVSQSINTLLVNGKKTTESKIIYTYFLRANVAGTFTLPVASILVEGKRYTSNSADIKILDQENKTPQTKDSMPKNQKTASGATIIASEEAFIRLILPEGEKKVGEPFEITYRLYTTEEVREFKNFVFPKFKGFNEEVLKLPDTGMQKEVYKGRSYYAMDIKKSVLYPQQSGLLEIPSLKLDVVLFVKAETRTDPFFGTQEVVSSSEKKLQSEPATINVLPQTAQEGNTSFGKQSDENTSNKKIVKKKKKVVRK